MTSFRITYVSHACLRIDGEFGSLLCDPWFLNEPVYSYALWKFPPAVIPPEKLLEDLDYLYITHSHEDHFHVPSIDRISRDVQVLLAEYTNHPCLRAQLIERTIREMGFYRVKKIQPWETIHLGGCTPFTVIPAAETRDHDWENSGFVIDHPGGRMLNMNDNCNDEKLCRQINARWPDFEIGFIQTASASNFPARYRMSEQQKEEASRNKNVTFNLQKRLIEICRLKRIVPFAGDFGWYDDRYFDVNWLGRSSPRILEDWIGENYPDRFVTTMYPSDTWSPEEEVVRNHPDIDWDNYLEFVKSCKKAFNKKVDHYNAWIDASDRTDFLARSKAHTDRINRYITQDGIVFNGRFRVFVEGASSNFSFALKASPNSGFRIDWDDDQPVDQSVYCPERIWAAILEGKIMWGMYQWTAEIEEHVPYRLELGRFWFWLEYNLDLGNKNTQAIMNPRLFPALQGPTIRPDWGVEEFDDDWDLSWLDMLKDE